MWANCPHQYKLAYVDKLKPKDTSIHLIFGTAIHDTIQQWLDKHYNEKKTLKSKVFDMHDVFKTRLLSLFKESIIVNKDTDERTYLCDPDTLKEFYLEGCAILDHVKTYRNEFFPKNGYRLIGCEVPLEMQLTDGINFIGYIDIVVEHTATKKIFIFDLKTSKKGWFFEKKDPKKTNQLLLYKQFYSQLFDIPEAQIEVEFLILKRQVDEDSQWGNKRIARFSPSHGTVSMKKATTHFRTFIESFHPDGTPKLEMFSPTPSADACRFCPFKDNKELCESSVYLT